MQVFKPHMITDEILSEMKIILNSGWIGLGGKTKEFEDKFSEYVGSKYAVGLNSATSALHLALIIAGVEAGDEVITTPMTFISTNHAILYQNAVPVFCDIDIDTLHIKVTEDMITEKTKAIIVVHYGGWPVNMEPIYVLAKEYNLWVIEDAAHAVGSEYKKENKVGSCSGYEKILTCFSFHAVKNLPVGDGGMITTNDSDIDKRLRRLRWMGIDKDTYIRTEKSSGMGYNWLYYIGEIGYKYHMNDISAVIGLVQFKYLDRHNHHRANISGMYRESIEIKDKVKGFVGAIYDLNTGRKSSCHMCVLRVDDRDRLVKKLNKNKIFPGVHYFPNHMYPMYKNYYRELEVAESVWKELITLPLHLGIGMFEVNSLCNVVNDGW